MDLAPKHPRLSYAEAREALKDVVNHSRFAVTFVNATGPNGWMLQPVTVRGRERALGMAPLEIVWRGSEAAVRIGRLANGLIPLRFDTRLLRNVDSLRLVAKHEIAELTFILGFENQFKDAAALRQLLELADDQGYEAEKQ